jgi:hypothetical protein
MFWAGARYERAIASSNSAAVRARAPSMKPTASRPASSTAQRSDTQRSRTRCMGPRNV